MKDDFVIVTLDQEPYYDKVALHTVVIVCFLPFLMFGPLILFSKVSSYIEFKILNKLLNKIEEVEK